LTCPFSFLQEQSIKDAEKLMRVIRRVQAMLNRMSWGHACSETLDPERHHPRVDVMAVTLHHFRLGKTERGWETLVILDI
jgi:SHS2 domain-containing protein